jgi:hypothetical protein
MIQWTWRLFNFTLPLRKLRDATTCSVIHHPSVLRPQPVKSVADGFEAQTIKPSTPGFEFQTSKPSILGFEDQTGKSSCTPR